MGSTAFWGSVESAIRGAYAHDGRDVRDARTRRQLWRTGPSSGARPVLPRVGDRGEVKHVDGGGRCGSRPDWEISDRFGADAGLPDEYVEAINEGRGRDHRDTLTSVARGNSA